MAGSPPRPPRPPHEPPSGGPPRSGEAELAERLRGARLAREQRQAQRLAERRRRRAGLLRRGGITLTALLVVIAGATAGLGLAGGDDRGAEVAAVSAAPELGAVPAGQTAASGPIRAPAADGLLQLRLDQSGDAFSIAFERAPRAGLVFDLDSGEILWRRNERRVLPIASLTKMMTALLVAEEIPDGTRVRVTPEALAYTGSGVGLLPRDQWIGVSTMLHGLLLVSGNDAAIALAQKAAGGSVDAFVRMMNARAEQMGLACTKFASPSGIIDAGNHSCAADLAVLARAVLDEPRLAKIVKRKYAALPFPIKGGRLHLANHNPLLREGYPGTLGIKTGYTDAAGRCLVAAVERGGRRYGVVLLHSPDPGKQAKQLLGRI